MREGELTSIAIIGAGPAGLTAALVLARAGVGVTVIERHPGTSIHPRARGLNVRTMEIYRGLGLEDPIRRAGAALAASRYMLFVETLAGTEVRRVPDDDLVLTGDALAAITPCTWTQCAQDELEPLLAAAAQEAGAIIRFGVTVTEIAQDDAGVTLTLAEGDTQHTLRADYVIAADGAKGMTRAALGIDLIERAVQGHYVNIYFGADLRALVRGREFALCFVENPASPGIILAVNNTDRWLFNAEYDPATTDLATFTPERCRALVRAAVGLPDLPVEVLSVLPWDATARYAAHMRAGRVFLVGDAAHTMPPAGGLGLNTGVADAHNLAWKLALVLRGVADPALLATYEAERLPVAHAAVESAARELAAERPDGPPGGAEGDGDPTAPLIPILGITYESAAIISDGTTPTRGLDLAGRPGTRLPHVWLDRATNRSSLDLVSQAVTLLMGPEGSMWEDPIKMAAARRHLPLACLRLSPTADPQGRFCAASGISPAGALLVRPDGMVAWRAHSGDALAGTDVDGLLGRFLGFGAD